MGEISTIGVNLKVLRSERGLSQQGLAAAADVAIDTIRKLEQGTRLGAQITTLMKLSNALDVEVTALTGKRERLGATSAGPRVLAIRDALLCPSMLPEMPGVDPVAAGEPTPLPRLRQAVDAGWGDYWSGRFDALASMLPSLLGEARVTFDAAGPRAAGLMAQTYELAAVLMVHLGREDLAAIAAERAIGAAAAGDDVLQWATVTGSYSWVLLHQGRLSAAEDLAAQAARAIQPAFDGSDVELAAWGNLLMTALAPCVAAGKDPEEYISQGRAAAARLGRKVDMYQTGFGPGTVHMQTAYAWTMLGEPGKAMKAAKPLQEQPGQLKGISYGRHMLDMAQAYADAEQPKKALRRLQIAHDVSPTWLRHQGMARSLLAEIREHERRLSDTTRDLVASVRLDDPDVPSNFAV